MCMPAAQKWEEGAGSQRTEFKATMRVLGIKPRSLNALNLSQFSMSEEIFLKDKEAKRDLLIYY